MSGVRSKGDVEGTVQCGSIVAPVPDDWTAHAWFADSSEWVCGPQPTGSSQVGKGTCFDGI